MILHAPLFFKEANLIRIAVAGWSTSRSLHLSTLSDTLLI